MAIKLTEQNYDELTSSNKLLVIDFGADWCGPCKALEPIIEELATEFSEMVNISKCNVDENSSLSAKYAIRNIPTVLFIKNNEIVDRNVGLISKVDLKKKIENYL